MCVRYLLFLLLIWSPGGLHAQRGQQGCLAPKLDNGYFVPEQKIYPHETQLIYACDKGHKPAVEGWWATSICQDEKWSHEPQCIDEKACFPPTILNSNFSQNSNDWYEEGHILNITCDEGYLDKNLDAIPECINGTWSSVPVCEKSRHACDPPPNIPNTVIINQEYQDVFAVDSEVHYECEDGFTVKGADTKKSIICIAGNWSTGPQCSSRSGISAGGGHGNTCGGHSTSAGCGKPPAGGGSGTRPDTGHGSSTDPAGGGSSSSSGPNEREEGTQFTTIDKCGQIPSLIDGDVVQKSHRFLKYQCSSQYKLVGPKIVKCNSDGTWTELPTCKATFCYMDTAQYPCLQNVGSKYIYDRKEVRLRCRDEWKFENFVDVWCTDGRMCSTECCNRFQHTFGCNRCVTKGKTLQPSDLCPND